MSFNTHSRLLASSVVPVFRVMGRVIVIDVLPSFSSNPLNNDSELMLSPSVSRPRETLFIKY